jgi:hypothetical protein
MNRNPYARPMMNRQNQLRFNSPNKNRIQQKQQEQKIIQEQENFKKKEDEDFQRKIDELRKLINIQSNNSVEYDNNPNSLKSIFNNNQPLNIQQHVQQNVQQNVQQHVQQPTQQNVQQHVQQPIQQIQPVQLQKTFQPIQQLNFEQIKLEEKYKNIISNSIKFENNKKTLLYGIKKTILSDFNYLYDSSNSNDFKIGLNKNHNQNKLIFDCFYLFPNISEVNTKIETNTINEKKVDIFENRNEMYDFQYFPLDYVPCGINIPLKTDNKIYSKLIIKNIYWNIFQSINSENYKEDELLCLVPEKNDYIYKKIKLQVNIELHSQLSYTVINNFENKILPYKNSKTRSVTPANSCLYKSIPFEVGLLNGSNFNNLEINLLKDLNISCALLCLKITIPDYCHDIIKGYDKYNKLFCGYVPFSQFIINLDYELV